ncbi:MAG: hypothetical protein IJY46_00030 [Lentisphaeria bacterium]|nr:hypothetical protein [Lentisphaeria bacterium]
MRKLLFSVAVLLICPVLAGADAVQIRQIWKRKKNVHHHQVIKAAGFFHDAEKTIFAFQIDGLEESAAAGQVVTLYWNADNNLMSGRFSGKSGFDFQLNINLGKKVYDLFHWNGDSRSNLVSKNKNGFQINGNMIIVTLQSALLDEVKLADTSAFRIVSYAGKKRMDNVDFIADIQNTSAPLICSYTPPEFTSCIVKNAPAGKGIAVPVFYSGDGIIRAFGVFRDAQKVVFAVVAPEVKKGDSMLIYWNSDGDADTGRFPGRRGVDVQFNATLFEQNIKVLIYPPNQNGKDKKTLSVYDDDFLIESKGGVLFVTFKNETMQQVKLVRSSSLEIVYSHGNQRERIQVKIDLDSPGSGFMPERLDFVRFGSLRQVRAKKAPAIPLAGTVPGVVVWDCQAERFREDEPTPKLAPPTAAFKISAARGERENLFFAVECKQPFTALTLIPGEFRHASGETISGEAVSLKYADFVINDRNERFTDVLLPAFSGRKRKRQFAVLSVQVPRDAQDGIYKGSIAFELDGKKHSAIPVELEVFNFTLPEKAAFPTAFAIKRSRIAERFRDRETVQKLFDELHEQAHRLRYSVRLLGTEPSIRLVNGKLKIDWSDYDRVKKKYDRRFHISQLTQFQLGSHDFFSRWNSILKKKYRDTNDPEFKAVWEQFVIEAIRHHKEQNFIGNTFFIIWDEPYSRWNDIINAAKVIRKHDPSVPIGIFIDKYKVELEPYIDIWLVSHGAIARMRTAPELKEKRVWLYNSGGMRDFRLPSSDLRGYYLLAWKYNIEGYLYSAINCLNHVGFKDGYFYNNYPTHAWMYVSNDGKELYDSWRQLLVTDGLDDFDYINIYAEQLKKHGKKLPEWLTGKFPSFNKSDGSVIFVIDSVTEWNELRRRIAAEIVTLQDLRP